MIFTASATSLDERCTDKLKFEGVITYAKAQLELALERDQAFRKQTQSTDRLEIEPKRSLEAQRQLLSDQQKVDLDNLKLLDSIVCKFGWPGIDAVGQRASLVAFF